MTTQPLHYRLGLLAGILLTLPVAAQTQLDLRSQSKTVDFGNAPFTRPLKTGADLPAACTVGEMFFRTSGVAGKNLYGCTTANIWTVQADVISPAAVSNYVSTFTNQTALTITAAMHGFDSPNILVSCFDNVSPANSLMPSGVTIDSTTFAVTVNFGSSRSGRCVLNAPGTAYTSGEGLVQSGSEISVDAATVPSFLRTQANLLAWTIPSQSCSDRLITLEGAALLDTVVPGWPADLSPSLVGTMLVTSVGSVTARLCNLSAATVGVPARTFGVAILRTF